MVANLVCVRRDSIEELVEEVKNLETDYDMVNVGFDSEEPKLILEACKSVPCMKCACDDKTIEVRYDNYEKLLDVLTEIIRIYNIEKIKTKISKYEYYIERIKERLEKAKSNSAKLAKYKEMIELLEIKLIDLKRIVQNPEEIEPVLNLGMIASDSDELEEFLDTINASPEAKQIYEYYASRRFIEEEIRLPPDVCVDYEPCDEEIDTSNPYWCVENDFEIEGYLIFLPAKKTLKVVMSVESDEFTELNEDVTLYTMKFDNARELLKTIDEYYENGLIFD